MNDRNMERAVPIAHIRLSQEAKERLIYLKRRTGLVRWNTLCRWALCRSLAESSPPPAVHVPADSSVEMDWGTFTGPYSDLFIALLRQRCRADGNATDTGSVANQFKLHLHRGIAYLASDRRISSIDALLRLALDGTTRSPELASDRADRPAPHGAP